MIHLTRLNGHRLVVNTDLVKFAEATPDTTLTLLTGERLIVKETCDELLELIARWRSRILQQAWPDAASALTTQAVLETTPDPTT